MAAIDEAASADVIAISSPMEAFSGGRGFIINNNTPARLINRVSELQYKCVYAHVQSPDTALLTQFPTPSSCTN